MTRRTRISVLAGTAVFAAAGLGAGVAIAAGGPSGQPAAATALAASGSQGYSWYRYMMAGYLGGGGMMGGSSNGWMMSPAGYQWMTGASSAPGWMRDGTLPRSMMGTSTDPGTIMGRLFADAPGPRISAAQAAALDTQAPAGATTSRASNTISFTTSTVSCALLLACGGSAQRSATAPADPALITRAESSRPSRARQPPAGRRPTPPTTSWERATATWPASEPSRCREVDSRALAVLLGVAVPGLLRLTGPRRGLLVFPGRSVF